jgi:hypothetical protein
MPCSTIDNRAYQEWDFANQLILRCILGMVEYFGGPKGDGLPWAAAENALPRTRPTAEIGLTKHPGEVKISMKNDRNRIFD